MGAQLQYVCGLDSLRPLEEPDNGSDEGKAVHAYCYLLHGNHSLGL